MRPDLLSKEEIDAALTDRYGQVPTMGKHAQLHEPTPEEIQMMKMRGMQRPKGVAYREWRAPVRLSPRHHYLAHLRAMGMSIADIAKRTGYEQLNLSSLFNGSRMQTYVREIQKKYFEDSANNIFKAHLHETFETQLGIMRDTDEKGGIRLQAANAIQDRALGKPTQTINNEGSLIREIYEQLQREKSQIIEVASENDPKPEDEFTAKTEQATPDEPAPEKKKEIDPIDRWLEENL